MKLFKSLLAVLLILLIFSGAALFILYKNKNKETKEITQKVRKNTVGSYVTLTEGQTHYEIDGQDTGKVVILIHGFSVPYYIWDGTFEYLVDHGYRVIRYDQYGRGFSDRPDVVYNKQLYMNQLKELIEKLHLKQPVALAGVSFGGLLATDFTIAYSDMVSKVILVDPAYNNVKPSLPAFAVDVKEAIGADNRATGQLDDFIEPDKHANWINLYLPQMEYKGFRHALISTMFNYPYNGRQSNTALEATHKPVLLIWGKSDKTVPYTYSDSIRSVLKAEFLPVDDAAHLPHLEQPDNVNPALVTFLKK